MAGGAAAASPAMEDGRDEWRRIYGRLLSMLRKRDKDVGSLLADRSRLEALIKIQHEFLVAREAILQGRLKETRSTEGCLRRCDELHLGNKERDLLCYQIYTELQDEDLEDFITCAADLAKENLKLKIKLREIESPPELIENTTTDHEHSGRDLRAEIRELKKAYRTLSSKKDKEIKALDAEKNFVWNQFKTMEKDYVSLLKKKKMEEARATEGAQKLQQTVEELQMAVQKKEDEIDRLQAEAKTKILTLEDKLQNMCSLVNEKDGEIQILKGGHLQASQKRKQNVNGTHRKSRSEGHALKGKSKSNANRQLVEEDQPETSQKRQCASSLANGLALRRCSSRLRLRSSASPAPQQVLFPSSFKVPKLKTPTPPHPL